MNTVSIPFPSHCLRLLASAALLLACGSGASTETADAAHEADAGIQRDAAPPDAYDDSAVEVFEAGGGDATVVFESGFGNDWTPWRQVAEDVAAQAKVFAYSRPGYGQSAALPEGAPRDASHIVEDLRGLLATRGYAPPYVLVGHSFGGTYMELFAKAHPEEVAGLVLVDPRHRDFTAACEEHGYEGCSIPSAVVATLPPVQIAEYEAFAKSSEEIRAAGSFGAYPVRVLTATSHGFSPEVEALWVSMLGALAAEAADGRQQVFEGANHSLETVRAHEVAETIVELVSAHGS